jgi:glucose-6-phosphate isomerase
MKLRRNVLQPLRLELDPSPLDQTQIQRTLHDAFASPALAPHLRFDGRPAALLQEYSNQRQDSIAGQLFRTANRIHSTVDSVVVLSLGTSALGAAAIAQACCQPYWNHSSRADRGSKPRVFFLDDRSDTDTVQGMLHLLGSHRPTTSNFDLAPWALVVLAADVQDAEAKLPQEAWQLEVLLSALEKQVGNQASDLNQRVIAVSPKDGSLAKRLRICGECDFFSSLHEPAAAQCFGPLGLLPATLLGVNIMELLAGAAWMSKHFHQAPADENLVVRFMAWLTQDAVPRGQQNRIHIYNPGLQGWSRWYRDLRDGLTIARSENPEPASHSMRTDGEIHVVVERPRFDPIEFGNSDNSQHRLRASIENRIRADREQGRSVAEIRLGELDELHIGQWLQFLLLVTASSRILGVHPPATAIWQVNGEQDSESTA